jgi:mitochondrial intermembrane space import and assembly protein 40
MNRGMQECFKKYPEIYGAELADDEDGAPTPDFGDEQPAPDAQKVPATDFKSLPEDSSAAAEPDQQAPPRATSNEAEKEALVIESRKVQDVATPIEKPHNPELWQDMHKTEVPVKEVFVEPSQAHDATAANAEIEIIEREREAKKKAAKKQ